MAQLAAMKKANKITLITERNAVLHVRVTPIELLEVKARAELSALSISEYVRRAALAENGRRRK